MSMHYEATVIIQITGESINEDCSESISKAFTDNGSFGTTGIKVSVLGGGKYQLEYYGYGYAEWKKIFHYCKKLASSIPGDITIEGSSFNEGSGGDYNDAFKASSNWQRMEFKYWTEGDTNSFPDVLEHCQLKKTMPVRTDFDYSDPVLTERNIPNDGRTMMVIPSHITQLSGGFSLLKNLRELVIPDSIRTFPMCSLKGCDGLEKIVIHGLKWSEDITHLCLETLPNLKEIEIFARETVRTDRLPESAFKGCKSLQKFSYHGTLRQIRAHCFENLKELVTVELPDSVEAIGDHAFSGCEALVDFHLPSGLKKMARNAFEGCDKLKLVIPETVEIVDVSTGIEHLLQDPAPYFYRAFNEIKDSDYIDLLVRSVFSSYKKGYEKRLDELKIKKADFKDEIGPDGYYTLGKKMLSEKLAEEENTESVLPRYFSASAIQKAIKDFAFKIAIISKEKSPEIISEYLGISVSSVKNKARRLIQYGDSGIEYAYRVLFAS